jgi:hypothetical protein
MLYKILEKYYDDTTSILQGDCNEEMALFDGDSFATYRSHLRTVAA